MVLLQLSLWFYDTRKCHQILASVRQQHFLPPHRQFFPWVLIGTMATSGLRGREKPVLWSKNTSPCSCLMCCHHPVPSPSPDTSVTPLVKALLGRASCWADQVLAVLSWNRSHGTRMRHRALQTHLCIHPFSCTPPQSSNTSELNYLRSCFSGTFPIPRILHLIPLAMRNNSQGNQACCVLSISLILGPDLGHSNPHLIEWLKSRRQQGFLTFSWVFIYEEC